MGRMPKREGWRRIIATSDWHLPHIDKSLLMLLLDFIKHTRPDALVLNGDINDMYTISRFAKRKKHMDLEHELEENAWAMQATRDAMGSNPIYYTKGNHEERINKHFLDLHPHTQCEYLKIKNILGLDKYGIEFMEDGVPICGMAYHHGNLIRKHSAYTAKGNLDAMGVSNICGHTHRIGRHDHTNLSGTYEAYEIGCLCHTMQEYCNSHNGQSMADWQQGFAVVDAFQTDRGWRNQVSLVKIFDGKQFFFEGKLWKVE